MAFCWFTSFIGYPNFFAGSGRGHDLAQFYRRFVRAARAGTTYSDSKGLFPGLDPAQVETKKAAYQEFGLLYVVPRSDTVSLTPVGEHVFDLAGTRQTAKRNRRELLLSLATAMARYQFRNPLPVGGSKNKERAHSSDVLPYLAAWYLILRLGGVLRASEFRGAIFGLRRMKDVRAVEALIRKHRKSHARLPDLPGLPSHAGTANNLRIYFWAHLSLDGELMTSAQVSDGAGEAEQALVLTQFGRELLQAVLSGEWSDWRRPSSPVPTARPSASIDAYFTGVVGRTLSERDLRRQETAAARTIRGQTEGLLDSYDVEALKVLPTQAFEEGRRRLVTHVRMEKVRSASLIRLAKAKFKRERSSLLCEICDFDFENVYGERGEDYIEAHHRTPISHLDAATQVTIDDLAMVCSNCHRMLHRQPWTTVEKLKKMIQG